MESLRAMWEVVRFDEEVREVCWVDWHALATLADELAGYCALQVRFFRWLAATLHTLD